MRYIVIVFIAVLALVACDKPEDEQPLLPPEEVLIPLLIDLHLAEMPLARVPQESRDSIGTIVRGMIAKKHNLTEDELQRIVSDLQLNPKRFLAIYDSVAVRLEEMRNKPR